MANRGFIKLPLKIPCTPMIKIEFFHATKVPNPKEWMVLSSERTSRSRAKISWVHKCPILKTTASQGMKNLRAILM